MQLFVIYVGGKTEKSLIELHDMRFAIANSIEETYDSLRKSWWGIPSSLHIDCYGILKSADGYHVHLQKEQTIQKNKLYFVNLGGYSSNQFTELHENIFVVAEDLVAAKTKALKRVIGWESLHRDYIQEVENVVCMNDVLKNEDYYISLALTDRPFAFEFSCKYTPIGNLEKTS